jgi:hypothetical protein
VHVTGEKAYAKSIPAVDKIHKPGALDWRETALHASRASANAGRLVPSYALGIVGQ